MRFRGAVDSRLEDQAWLLELIREQRASMARADVLRSILMIALTFGIIWFWFKEKIKANTAFILFILVAVIDYLPVSKRYLNGENFVDNPKRTFFNKSAADERIDQDDSHYRVLNLNNPFNEARTSYYHSSIGGYHGAKMRKYQDLIEYHLQPEMTALIEGLRQGNSDLSGYGVINMLNTKYIKFGEQASQVVENNNHNGNAWFVSNIVKTTSPDESIEQLGKINTKESAVINTEKFNNLSLNQIGKGTISLKEYAPNRITYASQNDSKGLAIFSEIYYPKGWKAYIDGNEATILNLHEKSIGNFILLASGRWNKCFKIIKNCKILKTVWLGTSSSHSRKCRLSCY
jgi:hypothetical protein